MGDTVKILGDDGLLRHAAGMLDGALHGLVQSYDTAGRVLIPLAFERFLSREAADNAGPAVASMLIYLLMAAVLFWKPRGLFPSHG